LEPEADTTSSTSEPVDFGSFDSKTVNNLEGREAINYLRRLPTTSGARQQSIVCKLIKLFSQQSTAVEEDFDSIDINKIHGPSQFKLKLYRGRAGCQFIHGPMVTRTRNGEYMPSKTLALLVEELADELNKR
jgi:hypothetical protein